MFCLFLGRTGSGKSYEMTVNHVLSTLSKGRHVSTNLPLNLEAIYAVFPDYEGMIDIKTYTRERGHPFSTLEDYQFEWRHPKTNQGPLVIIDEAHKSLPKGRARIEVLEFLAESRHAGLDIYYATQGTRKMHPDVIDLTDITYRMIKKRITGQSDKYIRKVIDGTRGQVYSTEEREYNPAYFKFYQSHTASNKAVEEALVNDIPPWYKHYTVWGSALCFSVFIYMAFSGYLNPFSSLDKDKVVLQEPVNDDFVDITSVADLKAQTQPIPEQDINPKPVLDSLKTDNQSSKQVSLVDNDHTQEPEQEEKPPEHPYYKMVLHVAGSLISNDSKLILFTASQNGQPIFRLTSQELLEAGYKISYISECSVQITFDKTHFSDYLTCDLPQISPV